MKTESHKSRKKGKRHAIRAWMLCLVFCNAISGCASVKSFFVIGTTDDNAGAPIRDPFGNYKAAHKGESGQSVILRTKKGDRAVEVELPRQNDGMTNFVIPVAPAFKEPALPTRGRYPASSASPGARLVVDGTDTSDIPVDYQGHAPTPVDREITRGFSQGSIGGPESEGRRREIEQGLGLTSDDELTPEDEASYLGALDHVKTLYKRGRFEAALVEVEALIRRYPTAPKLHQMRGTLLDRLGQPELAFKSWNQALRFDPQNDTLRRFVENKQQLQKRRVASP